MKAKHARSIFFVLLILFVLCGFFLAALALDVHRALLPRSVPQPSEQEYLLLNRTLDELFPERTSKRLKPLPYTISPPNLDIKAKSAILIDTKTGSILYEKNADQIIPPASLTKIVEMYVVLEAAEQGEIDLESIVPLPPESWAKNLPSDASRMYLAEGQQVTLRELLLGLAIASGNDASIAVAHFVSGTMDDFVRRMNAVTRSVGLEHTHFVESSGYSEKNVTTARDFALLSRDYINRWPFALQAFHAQKELSYPKQQNMPHGASLSPIEIGTITQKNTNKLLSELEGCDGLKTGFIYESGYNISVTAERGGTRFLSVTLGGPGANTAEGNVYRVQDNLALFNWAFAHFADYTAQSSPVFTVSVIGTDKKEIALVPAFERAFTVPFILGMSPADSVQSVQEIPEVPRCLFGSVKAGAQYGTLFYKINDTTLYHVPLVSTITTADLSKHTLLSAYNRLVYAIVQNRLRNT